MIYPPAVNNEHDKLIRLELKDGSAYQGYSFGAEGKSVAGELVFQTGMVRIPLRLT